MASLPSFAVNLARHREGLGLSQADLARCVGVSKSTIFRYEQEGGQLPPGALLVALSEVLGVAPKALLGSDARVLPEATTAPRVGRPPKTRDAIASEMLAELRGAATTAPTATPRAVTPTPARRTKSERE